METIRYSREVPVVGEYDIAVCGGGPAGWIAAVAAAREGKRVALIERYGFLGGTATAGYVVPISGFYHNGERVIRGLPWEFVQRLTALGAALDEQPKGHISVNIEAYKLVAMQMCDEAGVVRYMNSTLIGAETCGGRITSVVFANKSGTQAIRAKVCIDATGDGDLCAMAGVPMMEAGGELQPMSMCFVLGGVDCSTELMSFCIHHTGLGGRGSQNNVIRDYLLSRPEFPNFCGPWFNTLLDGDSIAVNITRAACDATDAEAYAAAEGQLRRDMFAIVAALREHYPEFAHCRIVSSAINAGVRETRHIRGLATLRGDDMRAGREYRCVISQAAHPMDIHKSVGAGQTLEKLKAHAYIPYEVMVAEGFGNLIAAGRMMSADRDAYASARVQATLMNFGDAAGVAAALSVETGVPTDRISVELPDVFNARLAAARRE